MTQLSNIQKYKLGIIDHYMLYLFTDSWANRQMSSALSPFMSTTKCDTLTAYGSIACSSYLAYIVAKIPAHITP